MAQTAADALRIEGLREFVANMGRLQVDAPKTIVRKALNEAAELVVAKGRMLAPVKSGALRSTIKASSTGLYARVSGGSSRVPYFGFIDYGNKVHTGQGVGRGDSQTRTFIPTGRILYPAFRSERVAVLHAMSTAMREAFDGVGIDMEEG